MLIVGIILERFEFGERRDLNGFEQGLPFGAKPSAGKRKIKGCTHRFS
jgi:hypothetical protein